MTTEDISTRLVDALGLVSGVHPGHRAAHAKGILCAATFTPAAEAAGLSRAVHFRDGPWRAHVRFSNGSGDPAVHDGTRDGRGIALKIYAAAGTTDVIGLTLPCFFVRTPEELIEFSRARQPDPDTGQPDMARVGAFLAEHPETVPAVTAAVSALPPASFARLQYHSIHAFGFVAEGGEVRYGRYHFEPEAGIATLTDEEAMARPADYLRAELSERLAGGPATFRLEVELADDGDPLNDPTQQWPEGRTRVPVGRLEINALAFDRDQGDDVLVFDPTRVADGITLTDDPILLARSGAYSESVRRRTRR